MSKTSDLEIAKAALEAAKRAGASSRELASFEQLVTDIENPPKVDLNSPDTIIGGDVSYRDAHRSTPRRGGKGQAK